MTMTIDDDSDSSFLLFSLSEVIRVVEGRPHREEIRKSQ